MSAIQGATPAPPAAGRAAATAQQQEQQQQPQQQSFLSRVGGVVMQLIFIQVVMQLVGSFTNPRLQQQQPVPEPPRGARPGDAAAAAGRHPAAAAGGAAGVDMLLPPVHDDPLVNLHPNAVLLNAFPPNTPFDAFVHLKYFTVLEPSSRRRAAAAAWGPAAVESDRAFYSQFFLPSEMSSAAASATAAGGDHTATAAAASAGSASPAAAGGAESGAAAAARGVEEEKSEGEGGLSGVLSSVLGSLKQLSPGARAAAAAGGSIDSSGSRSVFPRVPLWALWRSKGGRHRAAAAPAGIEEIAYVRVIEPPSGASGGAAAAGGAGAAAAASTRHASGQQQTGGASTGGGKHAAAQDESGKEEEAAAAAGEEGRGGQQQAETQQKVMEETHKKTMEDPQEIVYWGGDAVPLWQLLNVTYTYERWSASKEKVVSISPPPDFFQQFPLPPRQEGDDQQPQSPEKQQQQQQKDQQEKEQQEKEQQEEEQQEKPGTPEHQLERDVSGQEQQQKEEEDHDKKKHGDGRRRGEEEKQQQLQQSEQQQEEEKNKKKEKEKQQKGEAEQLAEDWGFDISQELANRKRKTVLCLVTTIVPHSAYINGRPETLDMETAPQVDEQQLLQRITSLMQPMPLPPLGQEEEHSLLLGGEEADKRRTAEKQAVAAPLVWHMKNRVDVSLVFDSSQHTPQNLRLGPMQHVKVRPLEGTYEPVIYHSDFWLLEKNFIPLNDTLIDRPLNLTLSFGVGSLHGWLVQEQLAAAIEQQQKLGLQSTREAMMFKRILIETNPFMLAFSTAFILLHSVFSFFAFKNDMQFWYRNDSMEGLSALSLIFNFVCEVIIGLYLFDSGETSWLILFEICLGILLSAWKVTKAMRVKLSARFPYVSVEFRKSYSDSNTKELDSVAIKWMSIILAPCVLGYAVYALIHNKYRSWYSYIISVLAGSVYTFGFITMTPQLYINYKLKSVDHLPWRALVYRYTPIFEAVILPRYLGAAYRRDWQPRLLTVKERSLNTFVDDVASFLIDMPWMHRLSCFRDDIIFICYLYQRWIYKVDETRILGAPPAAGAAATQQLHRDEDLQQPQQQGASTRPQVEQEQRRNKSSEDTSCAAETAAAAGSGAPEVACSPAAAAYPRGEKNDVPAAALTQRVRQHRQGAGDD